MHEPCLIRCSHCNESKNIFRPWKMNWLCIDCYNCGPVVQLDRTVRYGRIGWGFEFLPVLPNRNN